MSNALFPQLAGLSWGVKRTPNFKTLLQEAANGYAVRVPLLQDPLWDFELDYEFLRDTVMSGATELQRLVAFFLARQGAFDSFLLDLQALTQSAADSSVMGASVTPDVNLCIPLVTPWGETVYELNGTPVLYLNGSALTSGSDYIVYTAAQTATGTLNANGIAYRGCVAQLTNTPSSGSIFTLDLAWYYRVRFAQDAQEFEAFSFLLYQAQNVKLKSARE
jgi:hypothetical protein